jgi:O-antigen ligase
LPVLFTFLIPFGGYLAVIIILWFITSLFCFNKEKFRTGFKNPWFLLMLGFFFMHGISGLLSGNKQEGLTGVEVKLSFLAFPYFFFLCDINSNTIKRMMMAFVSGCFFALLVCLVRAAYIYFTADDNEFFYNLFSVLIHAGYFSMFMLFCILILVFAYPLWFPDDKGANFIRYFFIISFLMGIFLCASKMGYIAAVIILLIVPFIKFKEKLNMKTISVTFVLFAVIVFSLLKFFPKPFERLDNALTTVSSKSIDKTSTESTAVRLLIWKESLEIIKDNFWLGVGTGDANDVLQDKYREKGLTGALEHNLNTHNQYFQTTIALGVLGGVIMLILTFGALVYALFKRNAILALFSLIIILNFMVESMLQTQSGNLFFTGFLCLLLTNDILRLPLEKEFR